ncbi:nuclear transport factor 2 family protein [Actinoplanes sp. TFC3]|uniref:YybH family protein n=1 Tax=Actinoplanes sp. TFC3 TaxID=1710355 RepID=UPI00082F0B17|nr:nuclear transport factor 2 family protein [Actinoplanes sp. TFC3]
MTSLAAVTAWIENYRQAWDTNDPAAIGNLFAEDAAYFTEPYAKPWLGRATIVANWLARKDDPGTFTFTWHPVIISDDLAIIEAKTTYTEPKAAVYRNLWVLRLDDVGQARQFTEWWMAEPEQGV